MDDHPITLTTLKHRAHSLKILQPHLIITLSVPFIPSLQNFLYLNSKAINLTFISLSLKCRPPLLSLFSDLPPSKPPHRPPENPTRTTGKMLLPTGGLRSSDCRRRSRTTSTIRPPATHRSPIPNPPPDPDPSTLSDASPKRRRNSSV